jgi:hypothetical protein
MVYFHCRGPHVYLCFDSDHRKTGWSWGAFSVASPTPISIRGILQSSAPTWILLVQSGDESLDPVSARPDTLALRPDVPEPVAARISSRDDWVSAGRPAAMAVRQACSSARACIHARCPVDLACCMAPAWLVHAGRMLTRRWRHAAPAATPRRRWRPRSHRQASCACERVWHSSILISSAQSQILPLVLPVVSSSDCPGETP